MTQLGKGRAAAISDAELAALADELRCHPADLEAIAEVESSGFGWFRDGRIKILFEKHWFYKFVSGDTRDRAVREELARSRWVSPKNGGYADQDTADQRYHLLTRAMDLGGREAGLKSISIGKFQIMGFNHEICGFDTADAMWTAFLDSEAYQLHAFANFLKSKGLVAPMRRRDFGTVESGYNGGGLGGAYARKMQTASDRLRQGKWANYQPGSLGAPATTAPPAAPEPPAAQPAQSPPVPPEPEPARAPTPAPVTGPAPVPEQPEPWPLAPIRSIVDRFLGGRPFWTPDEDQPAR